MAQSRQRADCSYKGSAPGPDVTFFTPCKNEFAKTRNTYRSWDSRELQWVPSVPCCTKETIKDIITRRELAQLSARHCLSVCLSVCSAAYTKCKSSLHLNAGWRAEIPMIQHFTLFYSAADYRNGDNPFISVEVHVTKLMYITAEVSIRFKITRTEQRIRTNSNSAIRFVSVSYTHLTLPTILRV